ncbi:CCAAT/enhancer-binding protein zeta-like [Physella acuta]|uniref:CCAAT/enhancer-binding protein zeta-like n=1 Tax=Physella acuta TaxID=109671 RepID=UPI0027DC7F04|nr:CCAAT/enhancer-binding protein zeta-like [Physella acuta]
MAPVLKKDAKARGQKNKTDLEIDDLITEEDKVILQNVEDVDEESAVDVDANGEDIPESEILAFLQKLGVEKHRPFPVATAKGSKNDKSKKEANKSSATTETTKQKKDVQASTKKNAEKNKPPVKAEDLKPVLQFLKLPKARKNLLLKPGQMWREEKAHPIPDQPPDGTVLQEAEKLAKKILEEEISMYSTEKAGTKNSEARWLKTVLASGTLSDKMAALTLLIQESPVHNMSSIDSLIAMAGKKGRREAMMAVDTLRDLFISGLLPEERKLRAFKQQPLTEILKLSEGNLDTRDRILLMWSFEDQLKLKYAQFIKTLGEMSFDTLQTSKEKALSTIHHLLTSKPEQENALLPMLVNKLGDPLIKSKAMYLLTKLVDEHPNMKAVIVREVEQLLYRPNVSQRAQYYAICYLTQLHLSHQENELASKLIQIYFFFFQSYLKKGEVDNKMMSVLLSGVNRAYAFAKANKEELAQQMDAVYKIIPSVNFHTGIQALMLLYQVTDSTSSTSDRYYMCLYRKLADPALSNSSKQSIFMNLLFKSLRRDIVDRRVKAFIKRILQVYSPQPPQIICGVLILLSQILKEKPGLIKSKQITKGQWFDDDDEEHFVDQPDPDDSTVTPSIEVSMTEEVDKGNTETNTQTKTQSSWVHRKNVGGQGHAADYDPYSRNPLYSRAELELVWELQQLTRHYHPTVRLYAASILKEEPIEYDGDPVKDFTLARFLDRFVYKNPKKNLGEQQQKWGQFKKAGPGGIRAIPVNSREFLELGESNVPEDEKFFYRYFNERANRVQDNDDSDDGSVGDEEFDAFLDNFEKNVDRDDDLDDMDLDFAGDKHKNKATPKAKESESEESDADDVDDDDDVDFSDDELAAEFNQEMSGMDFDDSQMEVEFSPDEDDELQTMMQPSLGKNKKKGRKEMAGKKKNKDDTTNLFASAEEFAHLLEEETEGNQVSLGGTGDVINKDKAAQKQLAWEKQREFWLKDKKRKGGKPGHKGGKGRPLKNKFSQGQKKLVAKKKFKR